MNPMFENNRRRIATATRATALAAFVAGALSPISAFAAGQGEGCDMVAGRDGGQQICDAGLVCTGPFEGTYEHGNCQPEKQGSVFDKKVLKG